MVKKDLLDFGLEKDLGIVGSYSQDGFKSCYLDKKEDHRKEDRLFYKKMKIQEYLVDLTVSQAKNGKIR